MTDLGRPGSRCTYGSANYYLVRCPKCREIWPRPAPRDHEEAKANKDRLLRLCSGCYVDEVYGPDA